MTDRFTEATSELERKNAYVCQSCGSGAVHARKVEATGKEGVEHLDRFTEAEAELERKNAFVCDSCGSGDIRPATKSPKTHH